MSTKKTTKKTAKKASKRTASKAVKKAKKKLATKTKKKVAKKATATKSKKNAPTLTRIVFEADVGFGNFVSIRGEKAPLNWDKGIIMECSDGYQWIWQTSEITTATAFKCLINDEVWANNENKIVEPGTTYYAYPEY